MLDVEKIIEGDIFSESVNEIENSWMIMENVSCKIPL